MLDARARGRFVRNRGALAGLAIVVALVLFAIFAPMLSSRDPYASDFVRGVTAAETPIGPTSAFPLGTDRLYRDVFIRIAYGARISLAIGFAATAIATIIGGAVGVIAGFYEGKRARALPISVDSVLMRIVDIGLSFPFLLLVMAVGAALDRTSMATIFVTLGLTGWLGTARVLRAKTMQVRNLDFIVAARALGQSTFAILLRHVLPNVAGPLIVIATMSVAHMIVAESVLSYLGVGLSPPTPTWGRMLQEGQDYIEAAPWMALAPGMAILLAVFGFNLVGEGLRDALDPKEV